jgi:hypothetical protein
MAIKSTRVVYGNVQDSVLQMRLYNRRSQHVEGLSRLLEDFDGWRDPLSQNLHEWGEQALSLDRENQLVFDLEFLKSAHTRIDTLVRKILVDILGQPLILPLLDNHGRVWEASVLKPFCGSAASFSYDGKEVTDVRVHEFAQGMLSWAEVLSSEFNPRPLSIIQQMTHLVRERGIERERRMCILYEQLECKAAELIELTKEKRALISDASTIMEERLAVRDELWRQGVERIEKVHCDERNLLKGAVVELEHRLETQSQSSKQQAVSQQRALCALAERTEETTRTYQKTVAKQLDHITTTHQGTVSLLNERIDGEKRQHQETRVQLKTTQQTCASLSTHISHLQASNAQLSNQVNAMRNNEGGGGVCTIL